MTPSRWLAALLRRLFRSRGGSVRVRWRAGEGDGQSSAAIFLVLRRMRTPLIVLVLILAVSVLGLTLIPGQDADGNAVRLSIFEAFYFMSYTATTIGFGEIPYAFNPAQRLWVVASIYLAVIGWAYAIGSLLTLLQDRSFRQALAVQRFQRKVARMREPFLLLAGYGQTGKQVARAFDALDRRLVVVDIAPERIDALALGAYRADVPGLLGDASHPESLHVAGLEHPHCEGVLALTDDDEANLAITMAASLLRPGLPVIARTISPSIAQRMQALGPPVVVNPFDRYGDLLRLGLRAPSSYQLLAWLERGPGAALPTRHDPPRNGRWVVCGYGRFGSELAEDLQAEGLEVMAIELDVAAVEEVPAVVGDGSRADVLAEADLQHAVGLVAGTDNDTTNLSVIAAARRINPDLFISARQNRGANSRLFSVMDVDSLLVPSDVVAEEAYAQLSTPLLWRFLQEMPEQGDAWAARLIRQLDADCAGRIESLWKVLLTEEEAPALQSWLAAGQARLRDLLRDPETREVQLPAVPLLVLRDDESTLGPDQDLVLQPGDQVLLAGARAAQLAMGNTLVLETTSAYVITGQHLPSSWVWRRFSRGSVGIAPVR